MKLKAPENFEVIEQSFESEGSKVLSWDGVMNGFLTDIFTQFYKNATYATAREVITNGIDACTEAGVKPRIEVTVKGMFSASQEVVFKDNGIGMTFDILKNVFSDFGKSTKRETDELIGGHGLGCKTPSALSDTWTAITCRDGVSSMAIFSRNDNDEIKAEHFPGPEMDEDGTIITVPLETPENAREMIAAVRRVAYVLPPETVFLNGETCYSMHSESTFKHRVGPGWFVLRDKEKGITEPWNVIMGGILYPLDNIKFKGTEVTAGYYYRGNQLAYIFDAEISDMLPLPQRDGLRDNAHNRNFLNEKFEEVKDTLVDYLNSELAKHSYFEASKNYREHYKYLQHFGIPDVGALTWNGKELDSRAEIESEDNVTIYQKHATKRVKKLESASFTATSIGNTLCLYLDMGDNPMSNRKVVMDMNSRAREQDDKTIYAVFMDSSESFTKGWLDISKDSEVCQVITMDDVESRTAEIKRTNRSSKDYNVTYTIYQYNAKGQVNDRTDFRLSEIPDLDGYVEHYSILTDMEGIAPKSLKNKTILVLREAQKVEPMINRLGDLEYLLPEFKEILEKKFQKLVKNEGVVEYILGKGAYRWSYSSLEEKINLRKEFIEKFGDNGLTKMIKKDIDESLLAASLSDEVKLQVDSYRYLSNGFRSIYTEFRDAAVEKDNKETSFKDIYPLVADILGREYSPEKLKHAKMYVEMIDQMNNNQKEDTK